MARISMRSQGRVHQSRMVMRGGEMKCPHCLEETHMFDGKPRCINQECAGYDEDAHDDWTRNTARRPFTEERQATRTIEVLLTDE